MSSSSPLAEKPLPQSPTRMNSTNLYVTTTQIILKADALNPQSWQDLYRLVPYLRNSLCCVVCSMLLVDPLTPAGAQCQHHVCRKCRGGRKKIKPQCDNCKDCTEYTDNRSLRILMQMYKKMCMNLLKSEIFKCIKMQASQPGLGFERGATNLIQLIREGATFEDNYESQGGLPKSTYSILPCVYTSSSSSSSPVSQSSSQGECSKSIASSNQSQRTSSLYSVVYPGSGSKITFKRKPKESTNINLSNVPVTFSDVNTIQPNDFSSEKVYLNMLKSNIALLT